MNVLVLGGNGYIGSKVVHKLFEQGYTVVCTKRPASDISRLEDINGKIRWIPASADAIESALQYMRFDYVINMVCNYGRSNVLYDNVVEANIEFPLKVLNQTVGNGTRNFLTIGTGLPDTFNMYSFSKSMFSEFGRFYVNKLGIAFNTLSLEMFYGVDEPQNRFLPSIIRKMINGELVETTAGTQHRDIIAAEDIVKAIMMVLNSNLSGYNEIPVGTGIAPSISEIVDFIWEETGKKAEVRKGAIAMRGHEPDCVADTSFLKKLGSWKPIMWQDGLRHMIRALRESGISNKV